LVGGGGDGETSGGDGPDGVERPSSDIEPSMTDENGVQWYTDPSGAMWYRSEETQLQWVLHPRNG
jgi:hypothetical protein